MKAFESSSWLCVSCCSLISVHVMNLLNPVGRLDCDFWIDSMQICRGFHWNTYITISYIHHTCIRLQWMQSYHNYNIASSVDLLLRFWPSFGFVVTFCSHDRQTLCFSVKNVVLQWTQSKDNYTSASSVDLFYDFDLVSVCKGNKVTNLEKFPVRIYLQGWSPTPLPVVGPLFISSFSSLFRCVAFRSFSFCLLLAFTTS